MEPINIQNQISQLKSHKIKLISFDLDYTLFDLDKVLQNANLEMILEMKKSENGRIIAE